MLSSLGFKYPIALWEPPEPLTLPPDLIYRITLASLLVMYLNLYIYHAECITTCFVFYPIKLHVLCRYPYLVSPDTMDVLQEWVNADNPYTRSMYFAMVYVGKYWRGKFWRLMHNLLITVQLLKI